MPNSIMVKWADELVSGKYEQASGRLKAKTQDGVVSYCCLGVLCEIAEEAGVIKSAQIDLSDNWGPDTEPPAGGVIRQWKFGDDPGFEPGDDTDGSTGYLPPAAWQWAGLGGSNPILTVPDELATKHDLHSEYHTLDGRWRVSATALNDAYNFTFDEIAQCVLASA